ncbi:tetratricopeptide repeat protein [Thermostaphylospora chromogena]|uniref:Tetratricopeptide repeat-containing protein n=1 Tax=Thermostaphylospora chromogena TaxID=35622 RepID=A0A1H1HM00_9ACTN|nr:tetratricopeptide repeat protein [Thermostaphylospora chromogena]SDR26457.1 Tetratricopeptide repeat-containing protein [Thermostaphylospora chromogena]
MIQGHSGSEDSPADRGGAPAGDVYDWYQRGMKLLQQGSPAAACALLERAAEAEPDSRSIREALARAQFNSRQYAQAAESFRIIVDANPAEDYAYFGLGLSLWRTGDIEAAQEPLAIAAAMRPDQRHYVSALKSVRATLRARRAM